MRTAIQVNTPAFEGGFACTIRKGGWESILHTLRQLDAVVGTDAEASWGNMEANIEFQFRLCTRGAFERAYEFSPEDFSVDSTLLGRFEAHQSFFPGWIRSGRRALEHGRYRCGETGSRSLSVAPRSFSADAEHGAG